MLAVGGRVKVGGLSARRLASVDRQKAAQFLDTVARLSPQWGRSPRTKSRSLGQLLELYGGQGQALSNKTLNRYASSLAQCFRWAAYRGHLEPSASNTFRGQFRNPGAQRRIGWLPFEDQEVTDILEFTSRLNPRDHMRWVPLIGASSGMRSGEICSLAGRDIRQEDDVWFFDVTEAKTEAGVRRVPVHSGIIRAGFLEYLAELPKEGRVFPRLRPGGQMASSTGTFPGGSQRFGNALE
jgi:integrase